MKKINEKNVVEYIEKFGKRGRLTTDYLLRNADVINSMKSPIGEVILGYLIDEYEVLFQKILDAKNTDEERVKFKIIKDIILKLSQKIADYNRRIDEIAKATEKGEVQNG